MEKIIHQLWKDENVPTSYGDPGTWKRLNPGWKYILWTDQTMLEFMQSEFPEYLDLYNSYEANVQRADLFRYIVVSKMGGLYADIDTDCLSPLTPLENETRLVVCDEPTLQSEREAPRGFIPLQLNATFASPAGHPFWPTLLEKMARVSERIKRDFVLDSTGPCMFAGALEDYHDQSAISYNSSHLFNPITSDGEWERAPRHGDYGQLTICVHNWQGSWFQNTKIRPIKATHNLFWDERAKFYKNRETPPPLRYRKIDKALLYQPVEAKKTNPQVVIMVPVKDGAEALDAHWKVLANLDQPKETIRLVYVEGGSQDDTLKRLIEFRSANPLDLKDIQILSNGPFAQLSHGQKRNPKFQFKRRSTLAAARNFGIAKGLQSEDDWVLWMNVEVKETPPDLIETLLAQKAKIVAPHSRSEGNDRSADPRCFFTIGGDKEHVFSRQIYRRIYQAPVKARRRLYLCDLNYLGRVRLSSCGTNLFLVDADLHRAGLLFPEDPYKFLIEAEGFSLWAKDLGIDLVGLPGCEILIDPEF
ncbi:MAG: glycosyltransferase [Pseudomonadota bacterium]